MWFHSSALGWLDRRSYWWSLNHKFSSKHIFQRSLLHKRETKICQNFEKALVTILRPTSHSSSSTICLSLSCPCCGRASTSARWVSLPSPHTTLQMGNQGVARQCVVMQEDFQNKAVLCLPSAKPLTISPSVSFQSASPRRWPQLLLCSHEYALTYSQPCSRQSLPNSRQPCILSN